MENTMLAKAEKFLREENVLAQQITGDYSSPAQLAANIRAEQENLWKFLEAGYTRSSNVHGDEKTFASTFVQYQQPRENDYIPVIDIGGTHLRLCAVRFQKKSIDNKDFLQFKIEDYSKEKLGNIEESLSRDKLFTRLALGLKPFLEKVSKKALEKQKIALCFSYPVSIEKHDGSYDAYPLYFTKERKLDDFLGIALGAELNGYLLKLGICDKPCNVVTLNDTVSIALAGRWVLEHPEYFYAPKAGNNNNNNNNESNGKTLQNVEAVIGVVFGTGFNIAYPAPFSKGANDKNESPKRMIYNSEIGSYAFLQQSEIDRYFLQNPDEEGAKVFSEKRISGAYFSHIFQHTLLRLIEREKRNGTGNGNGGAENLLSLKAKRFIESRLAEGKAGHKAIFRNTQLQVFLEIGTMPGLEKELADLDSSDKALFKYILEQLVARSARMAALLSSAVIVFSLGEAIQFLCDNVKKTSEKKRRKVLISLEGGFVKGFPGLKEAYLKELLHFLPSSLDIEISELDKTSMLGAATANWIEWP